MVFDALNRQISETDPLNHTSTAVYDAASNLISTTDRDGRLETFSYDALNRKTGSTWIVSGSTTNVQTFTYDAASNQLTAADYNGSYTMAYDALNRMTSDQEPFGQALTYSYDTANNQIQIQDSQGGTTTSVYNALNELTTREFGGTGQTPLREDLTYTALGQIATETRYTDLAGTQVAGTSSYVYDTDGRLTNLTQTYANGSVLASYVYNYNQASLLTSEVDDGVTTSYSYDNANQLIQSGAATYGYDATGNRTNTGYQTGPDNQLLSDGTYSYTYDNEGNLETKQAGSDITTYSYNNQNELIGVFETVGGTLTMQATYVYDVFGNRLEADDYQGGVTTVTRSVYDRSNAWEDLNGSNVLQMRYFYLDGQNQMLARVDVAGNLAWYGTDHLGSVRIVLNAAGTTVLDQITYDANGNITSESSPGNRGNYGFTGYRIDMATGEDESDGRWYAPWIGVWTSEDPIQFAGGNPNLYGYVNNDPTNYTDPSGLYTSPPGAPLLPPPVPVYILTTVMSWVFGTPKNTPCKISGSQTEVILRYDFAKGKDDTGPVDRIMANTLKEVADDIDRRLINGQTIKLLQLGGHGRRGVLLDSTTDDANAILSGSFAQGAKFYKKLGLKAYEKDYEAQEALKKIAKKMAKGGKIEIVACAVFDDVNEAGTESNKLRNELEKIFGKGNVIGYSGPVIWDRNSGKVTPGKYGNDKNSR